MCPPSVNTTSTAAKSKRRASALPKSFRTEYEGGVEYKAVIRTMLDFAVGEGAVSAEQITAMVTNIGAATPFAMANATGGEVGHLKVFFF